MSAPAFSLTRNGEPIATVELGDGVVEPEHPFDVNEMQEYGFEIFQREPDLEYGIWIGDIEAGRASRRDGMSASTLGFARGPFVYWEDAAYFDGARGPVRVRLRSRRGGSVEWQDRAFLAVIVTSGKLSRARYDSMCAQMSGLAAGLVLDLVAKSTRGTKVSFVSEDLTVRTSAIQLKLIRRTWSTVSRALAEIARAPEHSLRRRRIMANCWGSERLDARSLVTLAEAGVDPRRPGAPLPFRTQVSQIEESVNTHEHRMIRGFLDLLLERARECESNIVRHINAIESDRYWRDRRADTGSSLYQLEDVPRLRQLREDLLKTRELLMQIDQARRLPMTVDVQPEFEISPTPVFANVGPYRKVYRAMVGFLRSGLVIVDEGLDERVKSTSRIYEQWVFLQLIAAMRTAGMTCSGQQGILHTSRMFRYTLDLDRGARVTFTSGGRAVVVRYEPWVLPRAEAIQSRDSVYRGRAGDAAWSPDILIEFLGERERAGTAPPVEYAVIIDAKYTSKVKDHHWQDTTKYLEIRSTESGRQIVRQQWIAFPGDNGGDCSILLRDSSLHWTDSGPECRRDENVQGTLNLAPPLVVGENAIASGWIAKPEQSVAIFVQALLRYMGIEPDFTPVVTTKLFSSR